MEMARLMNKLIKCEIDDEKQYISSSITPTTITTTSTHPAAYSGYTTSIRPTNNNNNGNINATTVPSIMSTQPTTTPPTQQTNHPATSTKMGSRRIFTPIFKLQVLDSYRNDSDCKGNQRATARKYNIHRRQIQKWLQCETALRSSVATNGGTNNTNGVGTNNNNQTKLINNNNNTSINNNNNTTGELKTNNKLKGPSQTSNLQQQQQQQMASTLSPTPSINQYPRYHHQQQLVTPPPPPPSSSSLSVPIIDQQQHNHHHHHQHQLLSLDGRNNRHNIISSSTVAATTISPPCDYIPPVIFENQHPEMLWRSSQHTTQPQPLPPSTSSLPLSSSPVNTTTTHNANHFSTGCNRIPDIASVNLSNGICDGIQHQHPHHLHHHNQYPPYEYYGHVQYIPHIAIPQPHPPQQSSLFVPPTSMAPLPPQPIPSLLPPPPAAPLPATEPIQPVSIQQQSTLTDQYQYHHHNHLHSQQLQQHHQQQQPQQQPQPQYYYNLPSSNSVSSAITTPIDLSLHTRTIDDTNHTLSPVVLYRPTSPVHQQDDIVVDIVDNTNPTSATNNNDQVWDLSCRKRKFKMEPSTDDNASSSVEPSAPQPPPPPPKIKKLFKPYDLSDDENDNDDNDSNENSDDKKKKIIKSTHQHDPIIYSNFINLTRSSPIHHELNSNNNNNFFYGSSTTMTTTSSAAISPVSYYESSPTTPASLVNGNCSGGNCMSSSPSQSSSSYHHQFQSYGSPVSGYDTASSYSTGSECGADELSGSSPSSFLSTSPTSNGASNTINGSVMGTTSLPITKTTEATTINPYSYSIDFKIQAIDSYYNDLRCRGDELAVADKYSIDRKYIQKWLEQEDDIIRHHHRLVSGAA